jgi:hypothetical protein
MLTSKVQPATQQIPRRAHALRIHVGHGKHPTTKKGCDLLRVDLVIFGFTAVDGFHIQGVAEYESDPLPAAQIGDPIPGEDTLHRHRDILAVWGDGFQESIGICPVVPVQEYFTGLVHDAEEHRSCMQVDAAVVLMVSCVESYKASSLGRDMDCGNYTAPPGGEALVSIVALHRTSIPLRSIAAGELVRWVAWKPPGEVEERHRRSEP